MLPLLRDIGHCLAWLFIASPLIALLVLTAGDIWYAIRYWTWWWFNSDYQFIVPCLVMWYALYWFASSKTRLDREAKKRHTPVGQDIDA